MPYSQRTQKCGLYKRSTDGRGTAAKFAEKYHLNRKTINTWVRNARVNGGLHGSSGRPRKIPVSALSRIRREVRASTYDPRSDQMLGIVEAAHQKEATKVGNVRPGQVKPLSKRTLKRVLKECYIFSGGDVASLR